MEKQLPDLAQQPSGCVKKQNNKPIVINPIAVTWSILGWGRVFAELKELEKRVIVGGDQRLGYDGAIQQLAMHGELHD